MKNHGKKKSLQANVPYLLLIVDAATAAAVVLYLGISAFSIGIIVCLSLNYVVIYRVTVRSEVMARYHKSERISQCRLKKIKEIIYYIYAHSSNKEMFYRKVYQSVNIDELRRQQILDFAQEGGKSKMDAILKHLNKGDAEFYLLLENDFKLQELSVIYSHSNPHSIYVKKNRVMARVKKVKSAIK